VGGTHVTRCGAAKEEEFSFQARRTSALDMNDSRWCCGLNQEQFLRSAPTASRGAGFRPAAQTPPNRLNFAQHTAIWFASADKHFSLCVGGLHRADAHTLPRTAADPSTAAQDFACGLALRSRPQNVSSCQRTLPGPTDPGRPRAIGVFCTPVTSITAGAGEINKVLSQYWQNDSKVTVKT